MKIKILLLGLFITLGIDAQTDSTLIERYREMALNYNYDLRAAHKNILVSTELLQSARADLKPKLSANANFQYVGNPTELSLSLPTFDNPLSFQGTDLAYGASISLLQPIYTGGKLLETIKMAESKQLLAKEQEALVRASVCYQIDIQYWNAVAQQELWLISKEYLGAIEQLVQAIDERVQVGLADSQDLLMAEVKLNAANFQQLQAKTKFEVARMAFNAMIGNPLEFQTEIERTLPLNVLTPNDVHITSGSRPELGIAEQQKYIAQSQLNLTKSQLRPKLYVGIDGSYSSPGYNFKKDMDSNYAIYAKLSIPIFEWGKLRSEKQAARFKVDMSYYNYQKVLDNVNLEAQTSNTELYEALDQVRFTESSLQKASQNEAMALERYKAGKISVVEVIDAQGYRQNAQVNFVQAKASAQMAYASLLKATNQYNIP